jgi:hypothetical protein
MLRPDLPNGRFVGTSPTIGDLAPDIGGTADTERLMAVAARVDRHFRDTWRPSSPAMIFWGVQLRLSAVDRAMARRHLAPAASARPPSKNKKRRSRGIKRNAPASADRGKGAEWSDLEQAFFASAPPDEPDTAAEPERFDDLLAPVLAPVEDRRERFGALGQTVIAAWGAVRRLLFGRSRRSRPASPR